ncbi:MAG: flagellin FliC, partial [Bdellovibrionota bacterium]
MGMRITTNVAAINTQRNLIGSQRNIQNSMAQLSSGSRINKSADDAAGLAISENMKAQMRSSAQARRNANDGISLVQTAEGALAEISNISTRMRELGIQAASDTVGARERGYIDLEIQQLKGEMDRIANTASWNSVKLLDGTTPVFDFQVGLYATDDDV